MRIINCHIALRRYGFSSARGRRAVKALLLLAVVCAGAALRFYHLGRESLWLDELFSVDCCSAPTLAEAITAGNIKDNTPPAHHIVLYYSMKYLGDSEAVARLPSAVAGVLSVIVMFFFGRRLYSAKEGLIAALLLAVMWAPVSYSQEARAYSMLLLFSLLSMFAWKALLDALERDDLRFPLAAAYVLSAAACAYTHYFGALLVFLQGAGLLLLFIRRKKQRVRVLLIYSVMLLAALPWLPYLKHVAAVSHFWIPRPGPAVLVKYLRFAFNYDEILWYTVLPLFAYFLYVAGARLRRRAYRSARDLFMTPDMIVLLWLAVPVGTVFIKSVVSIPLFLNRYLIISLPAVYLLLARAVVLLPLAMRYRAAIVTVVTVLSLSRLLQYYGEPQKEQWREAAQYILCNDRHYPGAAVAGYYHDFRDYYFRRSGSGKRVMLRAGEERDIPVLEAFVSSRKPKYLWYLYGHTDPAERFMRHMTEQYTVIIKKEFFYTTVILFETGASLRRKPGAVCR